MHEQRPDHPLRPRAWAVIVALALCIVLSAVSLPAASDLLDVLDKIRDGARLSLAETEDADKNLDSIATLQFVLALLTGLAWLFWQSLAIRSLRGLGIRDQSFPSKEAVLWWFVPFANLILPKRVMDAMWRGADPDLRGDETDLQHRWVDPLLHIWWLAWIAGSVGNRLAAWAYNESNTLGSARIAVKAYMASEIALILAAALAVLVVLRMTERVEWRQSHAVRGPTAGHDTTGPGATAYAPAQEAHPTSVAPPGY